MMLLIEIPLAIVLWSEGWRRLAVAMASLGLLLACATGCFAKIGEGTVLDAFVVGLPVDMAVVVVGVAAIMIRRARSAGPEQSLSVRCVCGIRWKIRLGGPGRRMRCPTCGARFCVPGGASSHLPALQVWRRRGWLAASA